MTWLASLAVHRPATGNRCSWAPAVGRAASVFPTGPCSTRGMTSDLSRALVRRCHRPESGWPCFETVDLQGKVGSQLFQTVVLPLEVFYLMTGGVSRRVPGETLFSRFHTFPGPGIEYALLGPLSSAEATNGHLPTGPFQNDAGLVFRGLLPAAFGPDLPGESPGLWSQGPCSLGLDGAARGHFRSRCSKSTPCTRSPNPPPPSCFSPLKCVLLPLNAYSGRIRIPDH